MNSSIERLHCNARMSKIVRYAGVSYFSGQTSSGTDLHGTAEQTREVLSRIDQLLSEIEADRRQILSATIYLRDMADFEIMNKEWDAWVPKGAAPARATVEARLARDDLRIEISVVVAA